MAALVAAALLSAGAAVGERDATSPAIAVVVGKKSFVTAISRDELRELYLRRQRIWPNGTRAIPINLPADNAMRERFSKLVLGRSTRELVGYWNARYFEGITPPVVLPSPAAIRAYLANEPGAIAYLPVSEVDDTCRKLLELEP
jgi:hypothetical protein